MPFQQRYASLILELERINRDLNEYLIGVQQCCHEYHSNNSSDNSFGDQCFVAAGPRLWNTLPVHLAVRQSRTV